MEIKTVKIQDPTGRFEFLIMDEKQFNPEKHKLFGVVEPVKPEPEPIKEVPKPRKRKAGRPFKGDENPLTNTEYPETCDDEPGPGSDSEGQPDQEI